MNFNILQFISKIVRVAIPILSNVVKHSTQLQKAFLYEKGVLDCFISLLVTTDKKILIDVLEGILNFVNEEDLLTRDMAEKRFKKYLKDRDAIDKIIEFQKNEDDEVSKLANEIFKILEKFISFIIYREYVFQPTCNVKIFYDCFRKTFFWCP